jgi:hypothetical protein
MPDLPSGAGTFLFTDIEGSIVLWERNRNAIAVAIERYIALLDAAITAPAGDRSRLGPRPRPRQFATLVEVQRRPHRQP